MSVLHSLPDLSIDTMREAALYLRVSTPAQAKDDKTSLGSQRADCLAYATSLGWTVNPEHVYVETHTGSELIGRPQMTKLRAAIARREIGAVVAWKLDRCFRDAYDQEIVLREAAKADIAWATVHEGVIGHSWADELLRYISGMVAKKETLDRRLRMVRGKRARAERGQIPNAGPPLYGYTKDRRRGCYEIHPENAEIVRWIYQWADDGVSIHEIMRRLAHRGVPSPAASRREADDPRPQPYWGTSAIGRILRESAYCGQAIAWRWTGEQYWTPAGKQATKARHRPESEWIPLPKGTVPAIVSVDQWQRVQDRLERNKVQAERRDAALAQAGRIPYLLRGLIRCATCGRALWPCRENNAGKRVYRCSSRQTLAGKCGGGRIVADAVEADVWARVVRALNEPELIAAALTNQIDRPDDADAPTVGEIGALQDALADLEQRKVRAARLLLESDETTVDVLRVALADLEREMVPLRDRLTAWEQRRAEIADATRNLDALVHYLTDWRAQLVLGPESTVEEDQTDQQRLAAASHQDQLHKLPYEQRRETVVRLGLEVIGNGRDWTVDARLRLSESGIVSLTYAWPGSSLYRYRLPT